MLPHFCPCDLMKGFLGLELQRPREIPPWAKAMANLDIPPWHKESPFHAKDPSKITTRDKSHNTLTIPLPVSDSTREIDDHTSINDSSGSAANARNADYVLQPRGYFTGEDIPRRQGRILPEHVRMDGSESSSDPIKSNLKIDSKSHPNDPKEVKKSWPEPREKSERRIVSANYSAVEIHCFFGLIDDGSVGEGRMLIVHVPKWIRGYFLDIKQGDELHVNHPKGKVKGVLYVLSTGRHKYYAPGRRVMTCTVCVSEEQWAPFSG